MKNKGFTLVELLAVIVVLAIISIITIPMIGNVIEESKKKALEVSANGLVEAANYFTISNDGVYEFVFDENKKGETIKGEQLDYKGNIEGIGKLYIDAYGDISLCLLYDKYYVYKNYNSGIYVGEVKDNSCIIGYDVLTNKYVAMLDDGTGQISNVYSKDEVNNLIDSVSTNVTNNTNEIISIKESINTLTATVDDNTNIIATNTNEISNIKGTIETLQSNLNTYALQSSLNTTNSNLESLSSIVSGNTSSITDINRNLSNINVWELHSTVKNDVPCGAGYCAYLVLGFQQNVGAVSFSLIVNAGNVVVNNLNGTSVDFLRFEYKEDVLYIYPSDSNHDYVFTVVGCSASE